MKQDFTSKYFRLFIMVVQMCPCLVFTVVYFYPRTPIHQPQETLVSKNTHKHKFGQQRENWICCLGASSGWDFILSNDWCGSQSSVARNFKLDWPVIIQGVFFSFAMSILLMIRINSKVLYCTKPFLSGKLAYSKLLQQRAKLHWNISGRSIECIQIYSRKRGRHQFSNLIVSNLKSYT